MLQHSYSDICSSTMDGSFYSTRFYFHTARLPHVWYHIVVSRVTFKCTNDCNDLVVPHVSTQQQAATATQEHPPPVPTPSIPNKTSSILLP